MKNNEENLNTPSDTSKQSIDAAQQNIESQNSVSMQGQQIITPQAQNQTTENNLQSTLVPVASSANYQNDIPAQPPLPSLNQKEIISSSINSTVTLEPNITDRTNPAMSSSTLLGHNDSTYNQFIYNSSKRSLLYPIIIVLSTVVVYVVVYFLLSIILGNLFESPKSSATMTEALRSLIGPSVIILVVYPIISVLFVSYFFKFLLKSKSILNLGYSIILNYTIVATASLFHVGIAAFMPSTYDTFAPIGILFGMPLYGAVYYLVIYAVLKNVKRQRYNLNSEDPNYSMYELLEATLLLLRRVSYVGIVGAISIPFMATSFA
jgi:hypothetical protein